MKTAPKTYRAKIDHLHLEALAERGFVSIPGDNGEFIIDLSLTPEAKATVSQAYGLLLERMRLRR